MIDPRQSRLGVDFGTTHTVAALGMPDAPAQPLLFDAGPLLSSAVFAEHDGRLLVGRDADRSARLDPTRFEPNPKRRIDDGQVLLGSRAYPVIDVIGAVLRRVAGEAARVAGAMPATTVITYPANWAASRKSVLAESARQAGMGAVTLIPEPVAAAVYFTTDLGWRLPPGGALVVYDFGGGTFDTTILRPRFDGGWDILASDGLSDVGGIDLDSAVVDHLGRSMSQRDPAAWQRLIRPADDTDRRHHRTFWTDVRAAKEQLSRASSAVVHLPLLEIDTHLTREEFEHLARPYLERTIDLTAGTMQRAGVRPDQVAGLFLVGGSSRIPVVSSLLHHRLGVAPTLIEQPELVVAQGSLRSIPWPGLAPGIGPAFVAVPPPAAPAAPTFGVPAPVSGVPTEPVSAAPVSGHPVSGHPVSGYPVSTPPGSPTSGSPISGPTTDGVAAQPPLAPVWAATMSTDRPQRRPKRSGLRLPLIIAGVVLLVCGVAGYGSLQLAGSIFGNDRISEDPPSGQGSNDPTGNGATTAPSSDDVPQGNGQAESKPMDRTVWYSSFKIQFTKVSYIAADERSDRKVIAEATITNLSDEQINYPQIPINYSEGKTHFTGRIESTAVPGAAPTNATFEFAVRDHKPNLGAGQFTIGKADEAQAVIPVDPKAGGFVALEPKKIVDATKFTIGQIEFTIHSCELRSAFQNEEKQQPKSTIGIWCGHEIRNTVGKTRFVESQNYRLKLPDGTFVAPAEVKTSLVQKVNEQEKNLGVQWSIPAPPKGEYLLQFCDLGEYAKDPVTPANTHEIKVTLG